MLYKFSWKMVLLMVGFLSSCFSMEKPEQKDKISSHYERAQNYFELGSECNADTEQEEKEEFANLAIAELKAGIEKRERDSIRCMMEYYQYGLGSVVKRDMKKYFDLQAMLHEESEEVLIKTLQSKNQELEHILQKLIFNLDKASNIQKKFTEHRIFDLLKKEGDTKEQAFLLMDQILDEVN